MEPDLASPLPEPPRTRRGWRVAAYTFAVGASLLAVGSVVRLDAYSIGPGPARNVAAMITISGAPPEPSAGRFLLTTVAVSEKPLTLLEGLVAWLDPSESVIDRGAIVQPGLDDRRQGLLNVRDIEESKYAAEIVALRAAGYDVAPVAGARIISVIPDSPAEGVLEPGDLIVEVDGRRIPGPAELSPAIRGRAIGATVRLTVDRDRKRLRLTLSTVESLFEKGQPSVGIFVQRAFRLPVAVAIDTGDIGGPSGGLVFALAITDALGKEDLTRGHRIAATGTIDIDGTVGPVGGVEDKIKAARHVGADVFIVPTQELALARPLAGDMTVIGVRTFTEAVAALRELPPLETRS